MVDLGSNRRAKIGDSGYASTVREADKARWATLHFGASSTAQVWLNGRLRGHVRHFRLLTHRTLSADWTPRLRSNLDFHRARRSDQRTSFRAHFPADRITTPLPKMLSSRHVGSKPSVETFSAEKPGGPVAPHYRKRHLAVITSHRYRLASGFRRFAIGSLRRSSLAARIATRVRYPYAWECCSFTSSRNLLPRRPES